MTTTWHEVFEELGIQTPAYENPTVALARAVAVLHERSKEQKKLSDTLLAEVEQLKSRVRMLTEGPV